MIPMIMNKIVQQPHLQTEKYGPFKDQIGDLYVPIGPRAPVVCLLHGGFWRNPYGRDQMTAIAEDLVLRRYAVWNLEYRRLGSPSGGWPAPMEDVVNGINYLSYLAGQTDLDLKRIAIVGHSAGGQLALLSAVYIRENTSSRPAKKVRIAAVAGQAPITDLAQAHKLGIGGSSIYELLGGKPEDHYAQYLQASPINRLPLGIRQLILHGSADDEVPFELSRAYAEAAKAASDPVELIELPEAGHMDFLDPSSAAHEALCDWLRRRL
jgi:acetyl esterase/lipase